MLQAAEEITINPTDDSSDGGADGEGGQPDQEKPAGDGGQLTNQQSDKAFSQADVDRIIGVNPEYAQKFMETENKMKQLEQQNQSIMQQIQIEKQMMELKNAPFFSEYQDKVMVNPRFAIKNQDRSIPEISFVEVVDFPYTVCYTSSCVRFGYWGHVRFLPADKWLKPNVHAAVAELADA